MAMESSLVRWLMGGINGYGTAVDGKSEEGQEYGRLDCGIHVWKRHPTSASRRVLRHS
jgi:hypothetical protein